MGSERIDRQSQSMAGIPNNELCIGRRIWNRLRYSKDPSTGRKISRLRSHHCGALVKSRVSMAGFLNRLRRC
ncbi:hypothetical protein D1114_12440 [Cereibacter sphaeroides]|uniref:Uncharacterized protein n=1 Tax=Cereibacter sphaeroides TaxID=1063 RepID=A0AAX1UL13_CERSP|nr:hypothetical protein D1114_12440 [Cereibacter sphaeroides]